MVNTVFKNKFFSCLFCVFPSPGTDRGSSPPLMPAKSGLLDLELLPKPPSLLYQLHCPFIVTQFLPLCNTLQERTGGRKPAAGSMCGHGVFLEVLWLFEKDANILPTVPGILNTCLSLPAAGKAPISKTLSCFQSLDSWEGYSKKAHMKC